MDELIMNGSVMKVVNDPVPVFGVIPGLLKTKMSLSEKYAVGEYQPDEVDATKTDEVPADGAAAPVGVEDDPPPPPPPHPLSNIARRTLTGATRIRPA